MTRAASAKEPSGKVRFRPDVGNKSAVQQITRDVTYLRAQIVNLYFVGGPGVRGGGWVLVDAGLPWSAGRIVEAAEARFGRGRGPAAIILTHGHFDHVGALRDLVRRWDAPVYAHPLELPYLTGGSSYPPPDRSVGGGLMARLAPLYPRGPINLRRRVRPLPADGSVPGLPEWRWLHTPGHTPGHVSLFRERDRVLLAGDAFVTTKQESALAVLAQREEVNGPPAYFTPDWGRSRESVARLAALKPALAATGHGPPMRGERLSRELERLARNFDRLAVPAHGRYVRRPAVMDARGVVAAPPPRRAPLWWGLGAALLGVLFAARGRRGG